MPGVVVLDALDAAAVHRWSASALGLLEANRDEIDALNVFPVPDSDTGTNMLATLRSAHGELDEALHADAADPGRTDASTALRAMSRGAANGAIGNSGFILSQILRGLAGAAAGPAGWGATTLRAGLDAGARLGREAVVTPVEGTILTVARAAADAAGARLSTGSASLAEVSTAVVLAADVAVTRTPSQLPDLAEAGVVDAGGRGLLVVLDALARTITGEILALSPLRVPGRPGHGVGGHGVGGHGVGGHGVGGHAFGYEVQYLLETTEPRVHELRATLAGMGDSVAVVPAGPDRWKVHAHVDDVGAAIEAGLEVGRPQRIEVVRFADQVFDRAGDRPGRPDRPRRAGDRVAVVAVAPGAGLAHLFAGEGVHVVEAGPVEAGSDPEGGAGPTTDDVVDEIRASRAREVVLLPNASRVTGVAEAAATRMRAQGVRVSVVPTRSPVQGLAAVAVHDADRRFDDNVVAMAESAAATRFAEVTLARSRALTAVGMCEPGDILGLIDGEVVEIGRGMLAVAFGLIDRLLGVGAELMTVLVGQGAPPRTGELIEAHVRGRAPLTDVTVYQGGQPDHPVIIGVE